MSAAEQRGRETGARVRIAAAWLPRFLIQRRVREDASLAHQPVAIVRAQANTDLVVAASRAALQAGVAVGGTATQARALCPGLILLPDDPLGDVRALEALAEALLAASPNVELDGPEGIFLDTSAAPLFARAGEDGEARLHRVILDRCRALGYHARLVVADNKFTAMALARHRPEPAIVRGPMREALAPLPLSALPAPETLRWSLSAMGLRTLGELAALPPAGVAARFGADGALMQRLAVGDDPRPLTPFRPAPPLIETFSLEWPAETLEPVLFALKTVLDRLTARLAGRGLALTRLEIQLRLDPRGESRVVLPLARPTTSSRLLLELFRERLKDLQVESPVIGVGVEALETGPAERIQLQIGDRPEVDEALEAVLARLRAGLGDEALFAAERQDAHRPEVAWHEAEFHPDETPPPTEGQPSLAPQKEEPAPPKPKRSRRAFLAKLLVEEDEPPVSGAPPAEADPLMRPGARPTRIIEPKPLEVELSPTGRLVAITLGAQRHVAASVRGPERLMGEWWRSSYARDYYRALVPGLGGCWIFQDLRDGKFYLHGYFD